MKKIYTIGALLLLIIYAVKGSQTIEQDLFLIIMISTCMICNTIYELIDVIKRSNNDINRL